MHIWFEPYIVFPSPLQVDVGGCMYFWGLTIDTVTSINLIVAIGLTVDYSAHIAHTFMVTPGDRNGMGVGLEYGYVQRLVKYLSNVFFD